MEEICNHLFVPAVEDNVNHLFVVFGMREFGRYLLTSVVEVTETSFQRKEEKLFSVRKVGGVFAYVGTPFVCHYRKVAGTVS